MQHAFFCENGRQFDWRHSVVQAYIVWNISKSNRIPHLFRNRHSQSNTANVNTPGYISQMYFSLSDQYQKQRDLPCDLIAISILFMRRVSNVHICVMARKLMLK